jgi:ferritin-like metal-binding protein YciE
VKKKSPKTKKARRKVALRSVCQSKKKTTPLEQVLDRIGRKTERRVKEAVAAKLGGVGVFLGDVQAELEALDAALGDDEE